MFFLATSALEVYNRIRGFEKWLAARPEERVVVVGHSNYFARMLGTHWKMRNCDVYEARGAPPVFPAAPRALSVVGGEVPKRIRHSAIPRMNKRPSKSLPMPKAQPSTRLARLLFFLPLHVWQWKPPHWTQMVLLL